VIEQNGVDSPGRGSTHVHATQRTASIQMIILGAGRVSKRVDPNPLQVYVEEQEVDPQHSLAKPQHRSTHASTSRATSASSMAPFTFLEPHSHPPGRVWPQPRAVRMREHHLLP
jgi:hypothetical protein